MGSVIEAINEARMRNGITPLACDLTPCTRRATQRRAIWLHRDTGSRHIRASVCDVCAEFVDKTDRYETTRL